MNTNKIGILAYGSLIDDPGSEIKPYITKKISCTTPFKVEFARTSSSRGGAPTLIPCEDGSEVPAFILVLNNDLDLQTAKSFLWRRERHVFDGKPYIEVTSPTNKKVVIKCIHDFEGIDTVIYTSIGKNIDGEVTADKLCKLAINSILSEAGEEKKDGLRYLQGIKKNLITTPLSNDYEQLVLKSTQTKSLEEAIIKLDLERESIYKDTHY